LQRARLSPDGRQVSYDVYGPKHAIAISSVAGGRPVVLDQESTDQHGSSWAPDGNWLAYRRLNGSKWELVKTPLGGGKPVSLDEASTAGGDTDWSPNGEWICHARDGGLVIVSADGKTHNFIKTSASAFGFSRDSTTLYAIRRGATRRWELAAFGVPRGEEKKAGALDLPVSTIIWGFSMHPSGKSFATSVGVARFDIWLLEGFLQPHRWFSWR